MGWWSTDVLGGDAPLDILGDIGILIGAADLYPLDRIEHPEQVRDQLTGALDLLAITYPPPGENGYDPVAWQVIGALAAATGAPLPTELHAHVLQAIADDDWATVDRGRADALEELRRALTAATTDRPVAVSTTGLFTAMAQMHATGQTGLVNLRGPQR